MGLAPAPSRSGTARQATTSGIDVEFEEEGTDWVVHDVRYEELTDEDGSDCSCVIVL